MKVGTPWTAEDDAAILVGYRAQGGARVLAQELGRTRNAIIGRAKRLGLSKPRPFINSPERFAEVLEGRRERRRERRRAQRQEVRATKARAKMSDNGKDNVQKQGVGLLELEHWHCRSLLGYDTAGLPIYCGLRKAAEGGSYCYMHYAIYHVQTARQRDRERLNLRVIKTGAWA